jgi:hypothetical protein
LSFGHISGRGCSSECSTPTCSAGELKIITVILERAAIEKILTQIGLNPRPPPRGWPSEAGHAFAAD